MRTIISAPQQHWDSKTLDKIRKEDRILFNPKGVHAIQVIERKDHNPLIKIAIEDDGHINFTKSLTFDAGFIDTLIAILEETKEYCIEEGLLTDRE